MSQEGRLRERFDALRREIEAVAPPHRPFSRAREARISASRRAWPRMGVAAASAAAVLAMAVWVVRLADETEEARTETLGSWEAPTDVLLDTPGAALLGTLPDLRSFEPELGEVAEPRESSHFTWRQHA